MVNEDQTILVNMRLKNKTLKRLDNLSNLSGISNKAQLIANSIHLTQVISEVIHSGGKIYIEENGKVFLLTIEGI
jgi:hypothetical protein